MFDFKYAVKVILLASSLGLSSCAITAPPQPDLELRSAALSRWAHCIHQFTADYHGSLSTLQRHANRHCDGHRRDVLATFPAYLENQVVNILSQKSSVMTTARYVRTNSSGDWNEQHHGALDLLKTRLLEAQQHDL